MFKDISKHSLVFVVIRKHDQVCDEVSYQGRRAYNVHFRHFLSELLRQQVGTRFSAERKTAKAFRGFSKHSLVFLRNGNRESRQNV